MLIDSGQVPRLAHVHQRPCCQRSITTGRPARPRSASSATQASKRSADRAQETCAGRIRYLGAWCFYDADRIVEAAASDEKDSTRPSLTSSDHDPRVIEQARRDGNPRLMLIAARNSPVYKMAIDWKVVLPLHPITARRLVWYVPPLADQRCRQRRLSW